MRVGVCRCVCVQFCCRIRFSSSSAERNRNAADSRYPAISWRTAVISGWLSWVEAPPPPVPPLPRPPRALPVETEEVELLKLAEERDFMLRSVGPEEENTQINTVPKVFS